MATITDKTISVSRLGFAQLVSDLALVGTSDTVELTGLEVLSHLRYCHVSVSLFDNAGGTSVLAADSAGSFTVSVKTTENPNVWVDLGSTIDATDPTTLAFTNSILALRLVPGSLSDTVSWTASLTASAS